HHLVIVASARVERDLRRAGSRAGALLAGPVAHRERDHAASAGHEEPRVRAALGLARHPRHARVPVAAEPRGERLAVAIERVRARDTDRVEPERFRLVGELALHFADSRPANQSIRRAIPRTTFTSPGDSSARPRILRSRRIIPSDVSSWRKPTARSAASRCRYIASRVSSSAIDSMAGGGGPAIAFLVSYATSRTDCARLKDGYASSERKCTRWVHRSSSACS